MLAVDASITNAGAETFVKEFFNLVAETLLAGESVEIDGFGVFERTANPGSPVLFTPSTDFADAINAPFSLFKPEMLNEAIVEEIAVNEPKAPEPVMPEPIQEPMPEPVVVTPPVIEEPTSEPEPEPMPEPEPVKDTFIPETTAISEPLPEPIPEPVKVPVEVPVEDTEDELDGTDMPEVTVKSGKKKKRREVTEEESDDEPDSVTTRKPNFSIGLIVGILVGLAVGALCVFLYMSTLFNNNVKDDNDSVDSSEIENLQQQLDELGSFTLPEATAAASDENQ
ncbi:MAG: HU family DNA-binding protein [Muribaculaceae bacterium]|nr:HU family DNA-binding protein [Muribaculaceae bacterium]